MVERAVSLAILLSVLTVPMFGLATSTAAWATGDLRIRLGVAMLGVGVALGALAAGKSAVVWPAWSALLAMSAGVFMVRHENMHLLTACLSAAGVVLATRLRAPVDLTVAGAVWTAAYLSGVWPDERGRS